MQEQIDVKGVQFGQEADQILQAAAEAINRPGHDHIEFALIGVVDEPVERAMRPATSRNSRS